MRKDISTNDKDINDLFLKVVDLVTQARESCGNSRQYC